MAGSPWLKEQNLKVIAGVALLIPFLFLGFLAPKSFATCLKALLLLAIYLAGLSVIIYLAYTLISYLHKFFKFVCVTDTTWWLEEGCQIKKFGAVTKWRDEEVR